ncbi:Gfo/Idh/MocA family oxidoreductase [Nonomuraea sp. NPDC049421]|uniref:Gfo/Idh/MocA family protein n=1 Tax=Nonomuraea sp. NPDC049421 TaxID=3155275 RepID=UPI00343D43CD
MTELAIIGYGNAGRQHLAAAGAMAGVTVARVVDTDPAATRGIGPPVGSLESVLADERIEVVAVCLPPGPRAAVVSACQSAGKHVIVEKPPARTGAELESLLVNGAAAGVLSAVMFQHRFALPPVLRSGAPERFAGAGATLMVSRHRPPAHYASPGWRSLPDEAAGGVVAHLGVHYLDLACQLLGTPVEVRLAHREDAAPSIDVRLSCSIGFANGAELTAMITSRSALRLEHLTVAGAGDWFELRDGAAHGEVDGVRIAEPRRAAGELRGQVYREVLAAVRGEGPLDLAALGRSRGVTTLLDGVRARPSLPAARIGDR